MKVIFIYDIELKEQKDNKRLNMVKKVARKYLLHVQKSVFEGELTDAKFEKMKIEILKIIDKNRDSAIFYLVPDTVKIQRKVLAIADDKSSNIL